MAQQTAIMRNLNTAQPDVVALGKGMDVIAVAQSHIHCLTFVCLTFMQHPLGAFKIKGIGDLKVRLIAQSYPHVLPCRPRHGDIIISGAGVRG